MTTDAHTPQTLRDLDRRSRTIFREIVEAYLATGEPVGSRTLSKSAAVNLSPASIRNTMKDLADAGLLDAAHVSAGRVPTHQGLRLFVDGLLEVGDVTADERAAIDAQVAGGASTADDVLERASDLLSGLAGGAGLVTSPTGDPSRLRHVEFVAISPHEALAVLVNDDGSIENRIIASPPGLTPVALAEAGAYLSARLAGATLNEARDRVLAEIRSERAALDAVARRLVEDGLATWSGGDDKRALIVRGQANLLNDMTAAEDLERLRSLFADLERKEDLITLLDQARAAQSVKIFIGAENPLFSLSGSSVIAAPYMNGDERIVGALGVIGPTRLNYARIIPLVDYTARVVSKLLDDQGA